MRHHMKRGLVPRNQLPVVPDLFSRFNRHCTLLAAWRRRLTPRIGSTRGLRCSHYTEALSRTDTNFFQSALRGEVREIPLVFSMLVAGFAIRNPSLASRVARAGVEYLASRSSYFHLQLKSGLPHLTELMLGPAVHLQGDAVPMKTGLNTALDPTLRSNDATEFEAALRRKIVGQDAAVEKVTEIYQMFLAGLNPPGRPVGNLLFLGPT